MDSNFPSIPKEGIFKKIINWFMSKTKKKEYKIENVETEIKENLSIENKEEYQDKFKVVLSGLTSELEMDKEINNIMEIIFNKIQKGEMQLEELTNEELKNIIELYNKKIEEKTRLLNKLTNNSVNSGEE